MKLDAQQKEVAEIFSGGLRYEVPAYQRNYAWKSEQVSAFLGDLEHAFETEDDHFFGSIVLLDNGNKSFSVIDGQQRLTTIVLLLSVLRDRIAHFDNRNVMQNGHPVSLEMSVKGMLLTENKFQWRYSANYKIAKVFENYVLVDPDSEHRRHFKTDLSLLSVEQKRNVDELRKAHAQITTWLEEQLRPFAGDEEALKRRLHGLLITLRGNAQLLRIIVDNEDDAFVLFETLNDRGLHLTASDLLKSFTLREIRDSSTPEKTAEALESWDNAVKALGQFPFTKFLRHYLLSVQKEKVQVKKIFALFKKRIDECGNNGALKNLGELTIGADYYSRILGLKTTGDTKLDNILARINQFSETHRIFLLRLFTIGFNVEQLNRAARALEILSFRWILTGGNAQEIETFYQTVGLTISSNDPAQLDEAIAQLLSKVPSDDITHAALEGGPAKVDLHFYVLNRLHFAMTNVELPGNRRTLQVEHLAPVKPLIDSEWYEHVAPLVAEAPGEAAYEDYLTQWGNLTLLEHEINASIQNSKWRTKVEGKNLDKGIGVSMIPMTKDLVELQGWNAHTISARTRWIADSITAITSVANVNSNVRIEKFKL